MTETAVRRPLTGFVGRTGALAELAELVASARMVTLSGTGGIGKTRLALELARRSRPVFAGGVRTVDLADVREPGALQARVAAALGLSGPGTAAEALAGAPGAGRQLLVLDTCEHLVSAVAVLCAGLLARRPGLSILATSREPLRVAGEVVWRVPPMSVAPRSPAPGGTAPPVGDAERLFAERVAETTPGLVLSTATVNALCEQLDGIPLAIELAAALTRVLSAEQIRERLSDRFEVLRGGPRTAPERQRTLLATVDWSYQLLSEDAKRLLGLLTVFRGGWTLAMAESVCTGVDDLLAATTELVDKSLVLPDERPGGQARYRMLDTIRDFAAGLLADDELAALRRRHLDCAAALAARGGRLLATQEPGIQRHWVMLEGVLPNLFAALSYADESGRAQTGLMIVTDMKFGILGQGLFEEWQPRLDALLAHEVPGWLRGRALATRALIRLSCGDREAAVAACEEAIGLSSGPEGLEGLCVASAMAHVLGVPGGLSPREVVERAEAAGDPGMRIFVALVLAQGAQPAGRLEEAQEQYELVLALVARDNLWPQAMATIGLAEIAEARGDQATALAHFERARWLLFDAEDAIDTRGERIRCLTGLGRVSLQVGDDEAADLLLRRGLELCRGLDTRSYAWELVVALARLAERRGDHARAAFLSGAASALIPEGADAATAAERAGEVLEPARRVLGRKEVDRLREEGRALPWNRLVARALTVAVPVRPARSAPPRRRPVGTLSERELEISRLVAKGLTNRAIADELAISQATVARHVSNILGKLGFASRAQIALWTTEFPAER